VISHQEDAQTALQIESHQGKARELKQQGRHKQTANDLLGQDTHVSEDDEPNRQGDCQYEYDSTHDLVS
jgi:hypothetical protein